MGLLKFLMKNSATKNYTPDFNLPEYNNWLDFLSKGGTDEEWKALKKNKKWKFPKSDVERFIEYQNEVKPISDKYYNLLEKIQKDWSILYNSGDYTGKFATQLEKNCINNIIYYERMREIDGKYGETTPTNIPALKRLAMLYERRGDYEKSIEICKKACSLGMDERNRMTRMIKKAGRKPNQEELGIINS